MSQHKALTLTEREPIVVRGGAVGVITAALHVAVVAGVIDVDEEASIAAAIDAIGVVVLLVLARMSATPNAKVISRVTTEGGVVAGDAAVVATGTPLEVDTAPGLAGVESVPVKPDLVKPNP